MNSAPNLAIFDLDHTLLPLDSDYSWGQFTVSLGWRDAQAFGVANERFYQAYKNGTLDIHDYVRFAIEAVREKGMTQALAAHERYMDEVIRPALLPAPLQLLQTHRQRGDTLLLVTATNTFVTRPIARALDIDHLIAIELQTDDKGSPTGAIAGTPSFREGKIARVEQWLSQRGWCWEDVGHSVFYSDSINDLPLLEKVKEPVATNPDERLRAIAAQRGWRVLDLFASNTAA